MSGKTVLMIVDDDKDDRFFFEMAVKELGKGFECISAENGIDAIEKLQAMEQLPDYIFLDLNMPLMNGRECLTELKKNQKLKCIPVIMYSTSSFSEDMDSVRKLGASYYLPKPANIMSLPTDITTALKTAESSRV
ncbi:MAG: response regulator [Bacteroidia bacterium]